MLIQIDTTLFRVVVHARNEFPAIDDAGINVEPNTATDIALKQVKSETLLFLFANCGFYSNRILLYFPMSVS